MEIWDQDKELARRCLAGDETAWRELVDHHYPFVYSVCLAVGLPPHEAEDVCQEVLLSALRGLRNFGGCRMSTWLYRITRCRIADHFRLPTRRDLPLGFPGDPVFPEMPPPEHTDAEHEAIRAQESDRVTKLLKDLDEPARSILIAYYVGEIPVRDISLEMGMPENTIKSHLSRGRGALRKRLEEES